MPKWEVVMLLLCWIYSNQRLRVQCKLCMNINDVYFDNSRIYYDVHLKTVFVLKLVVQFNIFIIFGFLGKYFACMY